MDLASVMPLGKNGLSSLMARPGILFIGDSLSAVSLHLSKGHYVLWEWPFKIAGEERL